MQCCRNSYFVLDPKGEIVRDVGELLSQKGYEVRVLDLISMEKSHCYNPFVYLQSDNDIQRLVTNLFKATTPKGSQSNDPFWDTSASMLLSALVYYLHYEAPEDEQNFAMVMEMLRAGAIENEEDSRPTPLDYLFADLEMDRPDHIALKYYRSYHAGSAKTLKSIQITLAARLEKFNLESLAALTCTDELDLASMGEKKVALFAIIPDNDSSFNFLVSILYTQLFQQLFFSADHIHGGALPIPVHFLMDEFANVSLPDDFDKILSVMRSRGVSVSIILQNLAQLKALFEKQWESIVGNCDEFLYLGGNEQSTHKYVSELLGKSTIDTNTYGKSSGRSGNYSTNYQISGRELLTPDEVRMLDNQYAILFIRATISWFLEHANPLIKVTIVPRGRALGAAWYLPEERQITTKEQMLDEMCATLGGRAAEEVFIGHISTGAMNDLERVTKQAYGMIAYAGMSDKLPNLCYYSNDEYSFNKPYSEHTAELIDQEVQKMINEQYARAKALLQEHKEGHNQLAQLLIDREVIFAEDVEKIFGKRPWASRSEEIMAAEEKALPAPEKTEEAATASEPETKEQTENSGTSATQDEEKQA